MLDIQIFKETFKIDEIEISGKNNFGDRIKVVPFTTNADIVNDFYSVLGAILRAVENLAPISKDITIDKIDEYVGKLKSFLDQPVEISDNDLTSIIKDIYFSNGVLNKNSSRLLKYAESSSPISKVALYILDVLVQEKEDLLKNISKNEIVTVLDELFYKSLPSLSSKDRDKSKYYNICPIITTTFKQDFEFVLKSNDFNLDNLIKLLEFYYFTYTSQAILKLNKRMYANRDKIEEVYFALDWEKISNLRKCVDNGYKWLQHALDCLFMNVIILQVINCTNNEEQIDFIELKNLFERISTEEQKQYKNQFVSIYNIYKKHISSNQPFNEDMIEELSLEEMVDIFFRYIKFQIREPKSGREAAANRYIKEFRDLTESLFVKARGKLGKVFNLTDDYLIFLTKLCIKNNNKVKLTDVFKQMEYRGIFFDTQSKNCIVKFYEKLNILEKKSDSGAVQYVKRF